MLSTKYFIIFSIIPFFIFAVPINDGARKALKTILKTMEKEITDGIRWRQTNCQDNSGFLDETEIAQKIQNLLKKMKNPKENLTKNDITNLFEAIEAFLDKIIEKMEVKLQTLEAYSPRMRFDEALKEEMKSPRKCFVNFGKSAEIESIHSYVDLNLMEKIRSKLTKLFILQTMAMPKKQQAYCQFFHMYYYKRQDLSKELSRIKDELDYGALAECATTTSWDETTQNYCCLGREIADGNRWRQTHCQDYVGCPDETKIIRKVQNLLEKVKNRMENVTKNDIKILFEAIEAFLDKMAEKMEERLQTLEAYSTKWRFDEALKEEMRSPRKCTVNLGENVKIESIHFYVEQNWLKNIRSKLDKLFILQTMAMPKKQRAYCQFFEIYYYKKQDLDRELDQIQDSLRKDLAAECVTATLWDKTTQELCLCPNYGYQFTHWRDNEYVFCPKGLLCLPCWASIMVLGHIVTVPMDICGCVRVCNGYHKVAVAKTKLAKLEAKKAQILEESDTSSPPMDETK